MTPPTVQFIPAAGGPIVWDDFTGTAGSNIYGRTPNQVNTPGNSWLTELTTTYYKIASSGADACAASENSASGMFIDVGTTTFTIEAVTEIISTSHPWTFRNGIHIGYDTSTGAFTLLQIGDYGTSLQHLEYNGSTFTTTTLATFSPALTTGEITWNIDVSGSSVTYDVVKSSTTIASGTFTATTSNGYPGFFSRRNDANSGAIIKDFKVY